MQGNDVKAKGLLKRSPDEAFLVPLNGKDL